MRRILFLLNCIILWFVFGCSTTCRVSVNGFSSTSTNLQLPEYSSISVVKDDEATNPIFEKEIAGKIEKLINTKGYSISANNPDYYLFFKYGIDSGRTKTGAMPIYESGGTATVNTFNSFGGSSFSTVQTPGHTTYVPYSKTVYTRYLLLRLVDGESFRKSPDVEPLWIGEITSSGSSSDLREVINYMLVVSFKHFGENTKKRIKEYIFLNDSRIKELKVN